MSSNNKKIRGSSGSPPRGFRVTRQKLRKPSIEQKSTEMENCDAFDDTMRAMTSNTLPPDSVELLVTRQMSMMKQNDDLMKLMKGLGDRMAKMEGQLEILTAKVAALQPAMQTYGGNLPRLANMPPPCLGVARPRDLEL